MGAARSRSGQKQGPPYKSETQRKIQGAADRLDGVHMLMLNEQERHAEPKSEQERPGAESSQSRSVQEREPSDRIRHHNLPQGTPREGTSQGRNWQEQGLPRAEALWS